jgi:AraC-like DNA-binding protein
MRTRVRRNLYWFQKDVTMTPQQKPLVLALFAYAAQRDLPRTALTKATGIDPLRLLKDENYIVQEEQFNNLWSAAASLSNDKLFGLHFGESLQLAALGVVGEIIQTSTTVGQAITTAASLTPLLTNAVAMDVQHNEGTITITLDKTGQVNENVTAQIADFLMAFVIRELDGLLFRKVKPTQVTLPFANPSADYVRVLRAVPKTAAKYGITLDASYADEPIITANFEIQKHLLRKVTDAVESSDRFRSKVQDYVSKNAYLGILTLEDVAANFNITPRSLQRRLQEESTTFQEIADEVRKSIALHYLESGQYQMKEISSILGYNEVSAFSRAFKRWTGRAPMEYLEKTPGRK